MPSNIYQKRNYQFIMKTRVYFLALTMLLSIGAMTSCKKEGCTSVNACNYDADAKKDDGTCIDKGQVTFWTNNTGTNFDIAVTINAAQSSTTVELVDAPICDASGCATFSLCPGSHSYTAREALPGTGSWSGNVVSVEGGCTVILLE
jgi:hypothetical protein